MKAREFFPLLLLSVFVFYSCSKKTERWEFSYPGDNFSDEAMLDLSWLNEEEAGMHGFIGLSDDKESFVRGDGEPVRFWSVNDGGLVRRLSDEEYSRHARFLSKMGVNMVRFHGSVNPPGKGRQIDELDTVEVRAIWKMVGLMKKEGIYSTISPFWAHNGHMGGWVPEEWGIEGYSGKDALWAVMYFNDRLKEAYKKWVKYLYTETNPYTGIPLKDEPAVGIIQIKNEDGVFFWTLQHVKPELKKLIGEKFYRWAVKKYGSAEKTYEAWNNVRLDEDDPSSDRFGMYQTWEMTQETPEQQKSRMKDWVAFLTETQYNFYKEIHDFYRNELGCRQLINANNWKTADPAKLNDLERYTNTPCEVLAVNRYYSPGHYGENSGWRIDPGHFYQGESALKNPVDLPVNIKQATGYPMLVTESGWNLPHKYQSEGPLLVSAYSALNGVDSYYWFVITAADLDTTVYREDFELENGMYPLNRWTYSTPGGVWMFPANALMFRVNYIEESEALIHEDRTMEEMLNRETPLITEENSYDPNRDAEFSSLTKENENKVNPLAYLTGKVEVTYDAPTKGSFISNKISTLINEQEDKVSSIGGELRLDYKNGIFMLNNPYARAVSGFLNRERDFRLGGLEIRSSNRYATIEVVSMDSKPLEESEKILVQCGTVFRPAGWKEEEGMYVSDKDSLNGFRIINTGHMPWMGDGLDASISIKNGKLSHAYILNSAGYPVDKKRLVKIGGKISFELPNDALYVILE